MLRAACWQEAPLCANIDSLKGVRPWGRGLPGSSGPESAQDAQVLSWAFGVFAVGRRLAWVRGPAAFRKADLFRWCTK